MSWRPSSEDIKQAAERTQVRVKLPLRYRKPKAFRHGRVRILFDLRNVLFGWALGTDTTMICLWCVVVFIDRDEKSPSEGAKDN